MPEVKKAPLVLISGASQGIGAAIARCFANADFSVRLALVARNKDTLDKVAAECHAAVEVRSYSVDVSDEQQVEELFTALARDMGDVSVLINNAGSWHCAAVQDMTVVDFDRVIAVNLRSTFLMSRMVLPSMLENKKGDIFSKALREEVRGEGIRVSCISPGPTYSPSWHGSGVGQDRLMPAEDVARAFLDIYRLDRNVVVEDIVLRPQAGHISS